MVTARAFETADDVKRGGGRPAVEVSASKLDLHHVASQTQLRAQRCRCAPLRRAPLHGNTRHERQQDGHNCERATESDSNLEIHQSLHDESLSCHSMAGDSKVVFPRRARRSAIGAKSLLLTNPFAFRSEEHTS